MYTRYYQTGGLTFEVNSELPLKSDSFLPKFKQFEVPGSGKDNIIINHYFQKRLHLKLDSKNKIYDNFPWNIYKSKNKLVYEYLYNKSLNETVFRQMVANIKHTELDIYNNAETAEYFLSHPQSSITLFPNDQILIAKLLADRQGCIFHSTGIIHNNQGYLFVGHSDEGKSTIAEIMDKNSIILCDDRNIIRKEKKGYIIYGTWYHSDFPKISPLSASLKAIFFLNQSEENKIEYINDRKDKFNHLIGRVIKPFTTRGWWEVTIDLIDNMSKGIDCLDLKFDKSGKIRDIITDFIRNSS